MNGSRPHASLFLPVVLALLVGCDREEHAPYEPGVISAAASDAAPPSEVAYVGHNQLPFVSVVGVPGLYEITRINVPFSSSPQIAIAPDGQTAYVTHPNESSVSKVDLSTNAVIKSVALTPGSEPFDVAVTPSGKRVFTTQFRSKSVGAIDAKSMTVLAEIPLTDATDFVNGIAMGPGGRQVFVASQVSGRIHVIDTNTLAVVAAIETGMQDVNELALTQDGRFIFGTAPSDDQVVVVDANELALKTSIPVERRPGGVDIPASGREAYVSHGGLRVSVIDTKDLKVVAVIPGAGGRRIAVNTSGRLAMTTAGQSLRLVDLKQRKLLDAAAVGEPGSGPWGIAFEIGPHRNSGGGPPGVPAFLSQRFGSGTGTIGIAGRPAFEPLRVWVSDALYDPVGQVDVSWNATLGGGEVWAPTSRTDDNGAASNRVKLGTAVGPNRVTASVEGTDPVTFIVNGEEDTGVFGFVRRSAGTRQFMAYDLTIQGRNGWEDPRLPAMAHTDAWAGDLAMLIPPAVISTWFPGAWDLWIEVHNLKPSTVYTVVLARYSLTVNGDLDVDEELAGDPITQPDELELLGGTGAAGYPETRCDFATPVAVLADANPFVAGFFETDEHGFGVIDCVLEGDGQWWSDDSAPIPPGVEGLAPFIPNSLNTSIGRFDLPSYNYLYVVEGQGAPGSPLPAGPIVLRWQVGIDLDAGGSPIANGYAPFPIWR